MEPKDRSELKRLIERAKDRWASMTRDEQEAMLRKQREGYVRAELSWPRDCPYR